MTHDKKIQTFISKANAIIHPVAATAYYEIEDMWFDMFVENPKPVEKSVEKECLLLLGSLQYFYDDQWLENHPEALQANNY